MESSVILVFNLPGNFQDSSSSLLLPIYFIPILNHVVKQVTKTDLNYSTSNFLHII